MTDNSASGYRVFARKYRPDNFSGLIGQDALVKTLSNAIAHGRLAHAFVLTGVRGVGKTSTARILARGLNCIGIDGTSGPTLDPCGQCEPCQAIAGARHVDVLEMDAASNTGVDDVRDIIEGSAYRPVSARFKIYIIDEVHMLSKSAFNALLKTLEEPPEAVKFIFATTEIRKVPVTILSRCQRFDLRRVSVELLAQHLAMITQNEAIKAETEALHMIARAAEGSVRDSLSLLDQAAAMNADSITASGVSDMLGHAGDQDVGAILTNCLNGDITAALAAFTRADERGADAEKIISDLLDLTHYASLAAAGAPLADLPESTISLTAELAELGIARLGRAWQIILKGHGEVKTAPNARAAAQMLLIRLAHAALMPTPAEILAKLPSDPSAPSAPSAASASSTPSPSPAPTQASPMQAAPDSGNGQSMMQNAPVSSSAENLVPSHDGSMMVTKPAPQEQIITADEPASLTSLAEIVALFEAKGELILAAQIRNFVRPVTLQEGHLEIVLDEGAPDDLPSKMAKHLSGFRGQPYLVSLGSNSAAPTLQEQEQEQEQALFQEMAEHPVVAAILAEFDGAAVTNIIAFDDKADEMSIAMPDDNDTTQTDEF